MSNVSACFLRFYHFLMVCAFLFYLLRRLKNTNFVYIHMLYDWHDVIVFSTEL